MGFWSCAWFFLIEICLPTCGDTHSWLEYFQRLWNYNLFRAFHSIGINQTNGKRLGSFLKFMISVAISPCRATKPVMMNGEILINNFPRWQFAQNMSIPHCCFINLILSQFQLNAHIFNAHRGIYDFVRLRTSFWMRFVFETNWVVTYQSFE